MIKNASYILVLFTAMFWGSLAAVGKLLTAGLDNFQILFFTNAVSFLTLFAIVVLQNKTDIIKKYQKKDYFAFAGLGFLGSFLYAFFFYTALRFLPAQEAFIINYLWPVMVIIFAALVLGERITFRKIAGIVFSFIGVALVISKGNLLNLHFDSARGIFFALAAAVSYSLFSVFGKKQNHDKLTSATVISFFGFVCSAVALFAFSKITALSPGQFLGVFWIGAFANGIAFLFWFLALKYGDTAKVSNMILLTPYISLVYIYFLIGEKIIISSIVGLAVIVFGILIQSAEKGIKPAQPWSRPGGFSG